MKTIIRNNYVNVDFYFNGIAFGVIIDNDYVESPDVVILIPFFVFRFKTYNFNRKNSYNELNPKNKL